MEIDCPFDGVAHGDTEHILINPVSSLQLGCNKHTHYLPFQKAGDGQRRGRVVLDPQWIIPIDGHVSPHSVYAHCLSVLFYAHEMSYWTLINSFKPQIRSRHCLRLCDRWLHICFSICVLKEVCWTCWKGKRRRDVKNKSLPISLPLDSIFALFRIEGSNFALGGGENKSNVLIELDDKATHSNTAQYNVKWKKINWYGPAVELVVVVDGSFDKKTLLFHAKASQVNLLIDEDYFLFFMY